MQDEPWQVKRLRKLEAAAPVKRKKWEQRFIAVPRVWANQLKTCDRAATFKLALVLLYEHWHTNGSTIRLTNALATTMGISHDSKGRALADLELMGLVSVERRDRKTPLVTVLHAEAVSSPRRM